MIIINAKIIYFKINEISSTVILMHILLKYNITCEGCSGLKPESFILHSLHQIKIMNIVEQTNLNVLNNKTNEAIAYTMNTWPLLIEYRTTTVQRTLTINHVTKKLDL